MFRRTLIDTNAATIVIRYDYGDLHSALRPNNSLYLHVDECVVRNGDRIRIGRVRLYCEYDRLALTVYIYGQRSSYGDQEGGYDDYGVSTQASTNRVITSGAGYYTSSADLWTIYDNYWYDHGTVDSDSGQLNVSNAQYYYASCDPAQCHYTLQSGCTSSCFTGGQSLTNPTGVCSPDTLPRKWQRDRNMEPILLDGQDGNSCVQGTKVGNSGTVWLQLT